MRAMSVLALGVTLLVLGGTANAKPYRYSPLGCKIISGTSEYDRATLKNPSMSQPLLLDCPLVIDDDPRQISVTTPFSVTTVVYDRNASENVTCQVISVTQLGDGALSHTVASMSSSGSPTNWQTISVSSVPVTDFSYLFCSIPPATGSGKSALGSYRVSF
jgi:hypothetical protein